MSEIYRAQNGARIELDQFGRQKWQVRFEGAKLWFSPFRTKFAAILAMSVLLRKSAKSLDWTPEQ